MYFAKGIYLLFILLETRSFLIFNLLMICNISAQVGGNKTKELETSDLGKLVVGSLSIYSARVVPTAAKLLLNSLAIAIDIVIILLSLFLIVLTLKSFLLFLQMSCITIP